MGNNSIKKNYLYNITYQLLAIALPLVTTPYISRVLGADGIGMYSFTYSIVTYFILIAVLGTSTYAQREIAFKRDDKEQVSITFYETLVFRGITTLATLLIYIVMVFFCDFNNINILLVQGIYIVSVFFDISWFFQGLEEFKKVIIRNVITKLVNLIFIYAFIRTKGDLLLYVLGMAGFILIGNISIWLYLPQYIVKIDIRKIRPFHDLKTVFELFIPTIAIQIYTVLDKTMIGMFSSGSSENGYYEQSEKIVKICLTIITSLGTVLAPRVTYMFQQGNIKTVKESIYRSYHFVWFLGIPICFGMISLSNILVVWFLGNGFEKCGILIKIFSILILAIGINNVTGVQYLIPIKKQNIFTMTVTIGAVVNLSLNLILIPRFLSMGAVIASITAETVIAAVQILYVVKKEPKLSLRRIMQPSIKYLVCGSIMFVSIEFCKMFVKQTFGGMVILAGIGISVYLLGMVISKDEFVNRIIDMIRGRISKVKK